MGLDMYLSGKKYVRGYTLTLTRKDNLPVKDIDPTKISYIISEVGYWRKANAIHKWFVDHVQKGVDDCGDYEVSQEKLQELLDTVNKVLKASKLTKGMVQNGQKLENGEWKPIMEEGKYIKDPTVAQELLPTASGFFFGNTDYNEWYYNDLVDTKKIIEDAMELEKTGADISYSSSW